MNKNAAIIAVVFVVILALLFRRQRQITVVQPQEIEMKIPPLNRVELNIQPISIGDFPEFKPPTFNVGKTTDEFDWMNTTNIACACNARTVAPRQLINTITEQVFVYVGSSNSLPPVSAPVFVPQVRPVVQSQPVRQNNRTAYITADEKRLFGQIANFERQNKMFVGATGKTAMEIQSKNYRVIGG